MSKLWQQGTPPLPTHGCGGTAQDSVPTSTRSRADSAKSRCISLLTEKTCTQEPLPAAQLERVGKARGPAWEDIKPLSHPQALSLASRIKSSAKLDRSILNKRTAAQPRCRRVRGQPRARNPPPAFLALPRQGQDASSSLSMGNTLPHGSAHEQKGSQQQQQRCLKSGCSFQLREGWQVADSFFPRCTQGRPAHVMFTSGTMLLSSQAENTQVMRKKWLLINKLWNCACHCNNNLGKKKEQTPKLSKPQ